MLSFVLNNGPSNSAGLRGYYTVGHPNQKPGFRHFARVLLAIDGRVQFYGTIATIDASPGIYQAQETHCTAVDWMAWLNELLLITSTSRES